MTKKTPQLSLILLNYNSRVWIEKCLASFHYLEQWEPKSDSAIEVIIVDNHSTDGSLEWLRENYPWARFFALSENRGFAAGNNVGMAQARAPFIMLLNTDTEFVAPTDLLSLLSHFEDSRVAVVTPKVILPTGELDHASHRGFPTPVNAFWYFTGIARRFPKIPWLSGYLQSWKDLESVHEIDACSGAAMIVRQKTIAQVGMLDESYFMYAEDIDWCFRMKEQGWKVLFDPSVIVVHHKYKSGMGNKGSWETKERTITAFYDTMKQFFRKFYSEKYPQPVLVFVFFMVELMKHRKLNQERKKICEYGNSKT